MKQRGSELPKYPTTGPIVNYNHIVDVVIPFLSAAFSQPGVVRIRHGLDEDNLPSPGKQTPLGREEQPSQ